MNNEIREKFNSYPHEARAKLLALRKLIFEVASELEGIGELQETLKWGEPSYISKIGSTIRIGWKESNPSQYAMYFHCQTKLVDTFRELYREDLHFEGNRAIIFKLNAQVPKCILKQCISLALSDHRVKHLPLLGQ